MITLLLAALLLCAPGNAAAFDAPLAKTSPESQSDAPGEDGPGETARPTEWVAEYVEYRCLPELGHITISDSVVRGRKSVEYLRAHAAELAPRGIFPCTDAKRRRSYRRTDEVAGHTFETLVVIAPPKAEDGDWTRRVTVLVDGRKKLDCSVGDSPGGEIFVYGVTIFPEDGTIEVAAVDVDGQELFPPKELERIEHPGVITDDLLQPDRGEDDEAPKSLDRA